MNLFSLYAMKILQYISFNDCGKSVTHTVSIKANASFQQTDEAEWLTRNHFPSWSVS